MSLLNHLATFTMRATIASLLLAAASTAVCVPQGGGGTGGTAPNSTAGSVVCPIVLDGRVAASTQLTDFDTDGKTPYLAGYVKGANLLWSQILQFPTTTPSRFDNSSTKAVEVTINQNSIFNNQQGFRRAGLIFSADSNTGSPGSSGVKTLHFSVMQDSAKPLNLSHEYLNVWHESSDYSANQFNFEAGTIIGQESLPKGNFKVLGRNNNLIWSTPIASSGWQNFAITLDYNKNTLQVAYSAGAAPLKTQLSSPVSNDNSGGGQFQIGILKKPTGTTDVVNSGYQESPFSNGQIYGGIFVEDSANGCLST
jgi:hypothetical protein